MFDIHEIHFSDQKNDLSTIIIFCILEAMISLIANDGKTRFDVAKDYIESKLINASLETDKDETEIKLQISPNILEKIVEFFNHHKQERFTVDNSIISENMSDNKIEFYKNCQISECFQKATYQNENQECVCNDHKDDDMVKIVNQKIPMPKWDIDFFEGLWNKIEVVDRQPRFKKTIFDFISAASYLDSKMLFDLASLRIRCNITKVGLKNMKKVFSIYVDSSRLVDRDQVDD